MLPHRYCSGKKKNPYYYKASRAKEAPNHSFGSWHSKQKQRKQDGSYASPADPVARCLPNRPGHASPKQTGSIIIVLLPSLQMYLLHVKNEMLYQGLPSAPRIIQLRNRISGLGAETGQILHAPRSTLHEKHQSGRGASKGERYSRYMSCSELYPTRKSTWYVLTTCPLSKAPTYLSLPFVAQRASKDMSPPPPAMLSTQGSPRATSGTTIGEGELIFFLSRDGVACYSEDTCMNTLLTTCPYMPISSIFEKLGQVITHLSIGTRTRRFPAQRFSAHQSIFS